ncbi:MAG: DUF2244 domain-containing protein [Burkholderiales bacterium]|nr:DUF2244 domain-containing protein [Burkholderiales bacterium]
MHDGSAADNQDFSLIARRNCSLQHSGRWRAFALAALVSGLIALAFASIGAWPILPFAGLELAALYVAFRRISRDAEDYEQVIIRGDRLFVERHTRSGVRRFESNRYWTQVVVRNGAGRRRIALRSHGSEIEFGTFLSDGDRLDLARKLENRLRVQS